MSKVCWPELTLSDAEREVWQPRPRPGILEHTRQTFILPHKTSRITGPWTDDYTPFVRRPLQLLEHPPVRVWISACRQGSKSTTASALLNYIFLVAPGPTGIVLPQQDLAKDRVRTKLRPLFQKNPQLLAKIGNDVRNLNIGEPTDMGDMILYMCWVTSIATLSDRSIQNMIYDEAALFRILESGGESPIEYGRDRQTTFDLIARELGLSSAGEEGDLHDSEMREGSDETWCVPCMKPGCGRWHALRTWVDEDDEKYIVVDRPAVRDFYDPKDYEKNEKLSRYVCPHCGKAWTDTDRWKSNQEGVYITKEQKMDENGRIDGPAWDSIQYSFTWHAMMIYPPYAPVRKLAAQFAKAKKMERLGDLSLMKKWRRSQQARPWKQVARTVSADAMTEKITDRPMGKVPGWVKILTSGADFHKDQQGNVRVEWEVAGWGNDRRSCTVAVGCSPSLDQMFIDTCGTSWEWEEKSDTPELMVVSGMVDAGYQPNDPQHGVIDEVYDFCRRYQKFGIWQPCMGGKPTQIEELIYSDLDKVVAEARKRYRRKYAGQYRGMKLVTVAVSKFKDLIADWAQAPLGHPGSTEWPQGLPTEYWKEFCNEQKVQDAKGRWTWQPKEGSTASVSHKLDLKVYSTAAAWHKQVYKMWSDEALAAPQRQMQYRGLNRMPRRRVGIMQRY